MPKVTFVSIDKTVEVETGSLLKDIVDQMEIDFPFGCRLGSCGTCRCVITDGHENVNDLTEAEQDLFESLTSVGRHERLGCQLTIQGDVKIRA